MSARVSVRQLKNELSEHLARVRNGQRLTVTLRGRPVAELGPPSESEELSVDERLDRLAQAGELVRARRAPRDVWDFEPEPLIAPKRRREKGPALTASEIILRDRG